MTSCRFGETASVSRIARRACIVAVAAALAGCTLIPPNQFNDLTRGIAQTRIDLTDVKIKQSEEFTKINLSLNQINDKIAQQGELVKDKFSGMEDLIAEAQRQPVPATPAPYAQPESGLTSNTLMPPLMADEPAKALNDAKAAYGRGAGGDAAGYDEAIDIATKLIAESPACPQAPEVYQVIGNVYMIKKDYLKAHGAYDTILTQFPTCGILDKALHGRASAAIGLKQYPNAKADFEQLRKQYPTYKPEQIEKILRDMPKN